MDVLGRLLDQAQLKGLLAPLGNQIVKYRSSLYADDAILFLRPDTDEMNTVSQLLKVFGKCTGLYTNFSKSNIFPIQCAGIDLQPLQLIAGYSIGQFPCTYLGIPLSDRRLTKSSYQPLIDKFVKILAGWTAMLLSIAGKLTLVKFVLSAMPTFQLLTIEMPKWLEKRLDKLRRAFLWSGSDKASGGKCLVRWHTVCSPREFGGLGIVSFQQQRRALNLRWLWQ